VTGVQTCALPIYGYFAELDYSQYKQGIEAIEHRWEMCIELKEDYVEK
jgi:hypothetical protein